MTERPYINAPDKLRHSNMLGVQLLRYFMIPIFYSFVRLQYIAMLCFALQFLATVPAGNINKLMKL